MRCVLKYGVGWVVVACGWLTALGEDTDSGPNLLPNASFEAREGERPTGWRPQRWSGSATLASEPTGRSDQHGVVIRSAAGADAGWAASATLETGGRYRLSGWIQTENVQTAGGRGALFNVHGLDNAATPALTGDNDWTQVEVEFDVEDEGSLQVNCLFGGWGLATGTARYDDVRLELLAPRPPTAPRIVVDGQRVGAAISARIYGQFIEHLGRCIYGGIWAEMLEDRKFYYPITPTYQPFVSLRETAFPVIGASPWQIAGRSEGVTMETDTVFVGQHTPRLEPGSGVRQGHLGVEAGKRYVGYAWLRNAADRSAQVEVTLHWGPAAGDRQTVPLSVSAGGYRRYPFEFSAQATTDQAALELAVQDGPLLLGTLSLMPGDHVEGLRADTLRLLRELNSPIYRWPGGNFVSGYDWRDGIGDRDRRPPRTNPAWTGVEHNDFGMHEFFRFCELVQAEPYITVNTGFGDAHSAAAQLEYCRGDVSTYWGAQRAAHGAAAPFPIRTWGIGNEMWGEWQLGFMRLEHYVLKHNWVVDTMRRVDPQIRCIASGQAGPWSLGLLQNCADRMDDIAEHFYCQERPGLAAHVRQIPDSIRRKAEFHRQARRDLPQLEEKRIPIAMTEWNYWYGPHVFGELGTRYYLKDALGIAAGLHEYARQSDIIESAYYAQTVNVIGAIKTNRRRAAFETTGLVLKLYRQHFGTHPLATETEGRIDAQAAWSRDRRQIMLGIVNPTLSAQTIPVEFRGLPRTRAVRQWQIADPDPMAYNDPDAPQRVGIEPQELNGAGEHITVAPCSVTLIAWDAEP